eukprot:23331-Eustigmatos_ZCMA.PRE.1
MRTRVAAGETVALPSLGSGYFLKGPHTTKAERKEYTQFLKDTVELAKSAEVVAVIPNEHIQRSPLRRRFFLDDVDAE